ncbi:MAG: acetyl-CoA C-acetyltransferase [Acidobacteria bacterium]|nr:acetyl-CoA C-acetyltransferase [Acidobacteriota bacterium]
MKNAFIVSACRTPVGKFLGSLKAFSAVELGALVVREAIRRAGIPPEAVDEVIMGNVLSAGLGQNPARQAALKAGIPVKVDAVTINKVCGSGLKSVMMAGQAIACGDVEVLVTGGMESMTNAPHLLPRSREGYRMGGVEIVDSMLHDGLTDSFHNYSMGCTAEIIAAKYGVTREEQDRFSLESHRRALAAQKGGCFKAEILPVEILQKGGNRVFDQDEGPREDISLEGLKKLRPAFQENGTVTAGNSSQISDGAGAVTVLSETALKRYGVRPMARIAASAASGIEPELLLMAPLEAIRKVRARAGWNDSDVDLYEVNEAFAVQCVVLGRETPLDLNRVNVHGGAVALGHPIGASGARVLTTLLYALQQRGLKRGVASLCLGGGNAVAMAVEMS